MAPRAEGPAVSLPALPTGWEGVAPLAMVPRVALSIGLFVGLQALFARWGGTSLGPLRRQR